VSGLRPSRARAGYLERAVDGLRDGIERAQVAERLSERGGLLQGLDPRVKVTGLLALAASVTFVASLWIILGVLAFAVVLAALSRLPPSTLAVRVWIGALAFTGTIAAPALFLVPGDIVGRVPLVGWPITAQGLTTAGYLVLRVETTATLACVLVFTTPWPHVLKALRALRVPLVFVLMLGMTYRYILLLLEAAHEMFDSRRSRAAGALSRADGRRLAMNAAGALFGKTLYLSDEVYLAMQSRGFRGEVHVLDDFRMRRRDWAALAVFVGTAALTIWMGR
jgi:cobalt/nickel transport system permease protein